MLPVDPARGPSRLPPPPPCWSPRRPSLSPVSLGGQAPLRPPSRGPSPGSGLSAASAGRRTLPGGNLPNVSSPITLSPATLSKNFLVNYLCLWLLTHRGHTVPRLRYRWGNGEWGNGLPGSHRRRLHRSAGPDRGGEVMRKRRRQGREGGKDLWATSLLSPPVNTLPVQRFPLHHTTRTDKKDGQQQAELRSP